MPVEVMESFPAAPNDLTEMGKREWVVLGSYLFRIGLLAVIDLDPLAKYCNEAARYWELNRLISEEGFKVVYENEEGGTLKEVLNPLLAAQTQALTNSRAYLSAFGVTPAMRAKLAPPPAQSTKDEFDQLFG